MSRTQSKYSPLSNILTVVLKWQCHEMYWHFLFNESTPSGPLINRLKWFCSKISFRRFICKISDSAQANTARSLAGINVVFAVLACAESDYAQANNFFLLLNISIWRDFRIILLIFRNIFENVSKILPNLRGVRLCTG